MKEELFYFTSKNATHRLILLHGWGADAEDLIPLGESLVKAIDKNIELISLRAPNFNSQGIGRQWYELFPADWVESVKATRVLKGRLLGLVNEQIPLKNTALLGFSQGGAMALSTGASMSLAGLIGCSAYPHPGFNPPITTPPILLTHGDKDSLVPLDASKTLLELITRNSTSFSELRVFDGFHEIPKELVGYIQIFLEKCFE